MTEKVLTGCKASKQKTINLIPEVIYCDIIGQNIDK